MMEFLLWFGASILSTLGFMYFFAKINKIEVITKKSIFIFFMGVMFLTLLKFFDVNSVSVLSFFIFYPILFYSLSHLNLKKVFINCLVIYLVGIFLDLMAMVIVSIICDAFKIDINIYLNVFVIISSVYVFLIFIVLGKNMMAVKLLNKLIQFIVDIRYSNFSLFLFCLFLFIFSLIFFVNLNRMNVDILLLVIVFLSIGLFILLLKFRINAEENRKYLVTLKENNDFYIKMDDENRIFKHNLMAKLTSIKSVSNQKAIDLIDDFVIKTNKDLTYFSKVKSVPYGLNGIIYQNTYPYLEDINFKTTNNINFDIFEVLKPRRYNVLVEKLVVCLNNAIEASINSQNKIVVINIDTDDDYIYIEIKNTFSDDLNIDSLGNKAYSTKGKKRGLGLFSTLRNNEVTMKVKVINNYFVCTLIAKKQKNSILD